MNCEKCQDLFSDLLDGSITSQDQGVLSAHLKECLSCVGVRDEMQTIIGVAQECREDFTAPPNERALWLRIRNTIEIELAANRAVAAAATAPRAVAASSRDGFWSRVMDKRWELSLPQLTAAIFALVVGVSALTAVGVQGFRGEATTGTTLNSNSSLEGGRSGLAGVSPAASYHQAYVQHQQASIGYWKQQVEQRQASWNPQMRDAYQRSMQVIDQAVNESLTALDRNPHDEVSAEMLNAALRDKMELLREFSEQ